MELQYSYLNGLFYHRLFKYQKKAYLSLATIFVYHLYCCSSLYP
jgi:hypothetical protein